MIILEKTIVQMLNVITDREKARTNQIEVKILREMSPFIVVSVVKCKIHNEDIVSTVFYSTCIYSTKNNGRKNKTNNNIIKNKDKQKYHGSGRV